MSLNPVFSWVFCCFNVSSFPVDFLLKTKNPQNLNDFKGIKWYLQGSNQGHTDFQSVALPSELRYLLQILSIAAC